MGTVGISRQAALRAAVAGTGMAAIYSLSGSLVRRVGGAPVSSTMANLPAGAYVAGSAVRASDRLLSR